MSEDDIVTTEMILGFNLEPHQRAWLESLDLTPQQAARAILLPPSKPEHERRRLR